MTWFSLWAAVLLWAVAIPSSASALRVAVAANMQYVFNDVKIAFKQKTGNDLEASFGTSGKLATQILHGAPFDVFMSADIEYPEKIHAAGLTTTPPKIYAYGALVLWTVKDIELNDWPNLLLSPLISRIVIANPKTSPYGRESVRVLEHFNLNDRLKDKLVYGEGIAQTNQYIHSRAADIGITAKSVVLSSELKGQGRWVALPQAAYQPIAQAAVVLREGERRQPQLARQFHAFLYSDQARAIFSRYGYTLP